LLEKSRVVHQNETESTFHIFYLLVCGITEEEKENFLINTKDLKYRCMKNNNLFLNDPAVIRENREKFNLIKENMKTIGFSSEVLHILGNFS
jgi:myosin heavy subunit